MRPNHVISFQEVDEATETWTTSHKAVATINRVSGSESDSSGSERQSVTLTFRMPYQSWMDDIRFATGSWRIVYMGRCFNITDYDDFFETHRSVTLTAESIGGKAHD